MPELVECCGARLFPGECCDACGKVAGRSNHRRGWWNLPCFNGLSAEQQQRVVEVGNLEIGYQPEGKCLNGAEIEITTMWDKFPGPRFYCIRCGIEFLQSFQPASSHCTCGYGGFHEPFNPRCALNQPSDAT